MALEDVPLSAVDRRDQLRIGAVSAGVTILVMSICFAVIGGLLIVRETVLLFNLWTRALALGVMYLLPHFLAGAVVGTRYGVGVVEPLVAGVVPILVAVVGLAAFGGPVGTILSAPLVLVVVLVVWTGLFAAGQVVGARALAPRLDDLDLARIRSND